MNLSFANKIWRTKNIFSGLTARNTLAYSVLEPTKRTFSKSNLEFNPYFDSGSFIIPHPKKVDTGGEDAVLVKNRLIVVADGVGAWGPIAGEYSRKLVRLIGELYEENPNSSPKKILLEADNRLVKEKGSST
jgi:hypothetical protein